MIIGFCGASAIALSGAHAAPLVVTGQPTVRVGLQYRPRNQSATGGGYRIAVSLDPKRMAKELGTKRLALRSVHARIPYYDGGNNLQWADTKLNFAGRSTVAAHVNGRTGDVLPKQEVLTFRSDGALKGTQDATVEQQGVNFYATARQTGAQKIWLQQLGANAKPTTPSKNGLEPEMILGKVAP